MANQALMKLDLIESIIDVIYQWAHYNEVSSIDYSVFRIDLL